MLNEKINFIDRFLYLGVHTRTGSGAFPNCGSGSTALDPDPQPWIRIHNPVDKTMEEEELAWACVTRLEVYATFGHLPSSYIMNTCMQEIEIERERVCVCV